MDIKGPATSPPINKSQLYECKTKTGMQKQKNIDFLNFPKNNPKIPALTHNDRQRSYRADQCVFAKVFEQQMGSEK